MKYHNTRRGFTLIELLVVVLIVGILAAVAVPQYQVAVAKSQYATLKHLVRAATEAEEVYYLANGVYTQHIDELDIDFPSPSQSDCLTNGGDRCVYRYDWGRCEIEYGIPTCCKDQGNLYICYTQYPKHITGTYRSYAGKQKCMARAHKNEIAHKVCRQDSGLSIGNANSGAWYIW